ncbi:NLR family CARD domain-containing protein 4 [Holothuria leucospilota]|uniref:NLR family CARD domain-containing protein 4 n=1 Tax=Holothuria leucospilota TaxID=206669 RepID=A0A9Q1CPX4_HOLLE|nr:NLR family CARD domain-containing protein 4 [Holothuria leucospilota]
MQKRLFISELKATYQNLYDAVQPIPFIKDRLYCVNNVFVDGGIEFWVTKDTISKKGTWEKLQSYHEILCDTRVKSSRYILEGAPGYGKSTLCLQLAFDWCNQITSSPLKDIDMLILLSLNQLGGVVKSIFAAIKQLLLPKDTLLTEELIQRILSNSSSVLIVLDGFDEYPYQASDEKSDIMSIIAREMFQQFDVILTTRSSHLPREYPALTKRLKLTGFDNISRDKYIQKAVVGYDIEAAKKVHERLSNIPILRDICQVPFIFVMFAHLSHESKTFQTFQPVTCSFRYIISCFMSHMKRKMTNENFQNYDLFEENHRTLHKLAFEGLISKVRPIIWSKKYLSDKLGKQSYEKYVRIGILVEEGPINISDESDSKSLECIEYKAKVRFFHQSFCEWYAAHYLSDHRTLDDVTFHFSHNLMRLNESEASNVVFMDNATNVNAKEDYFHSLDPWDFHYFYRFASGLNFAVAKYTIEYLKDQNGTNSFIILCNLEQYGKTKEGMQQVKEFCSTGPCIDKSYSLLLQRSTIQLLEIASLNKIPILSLNLRECYHSVDVEGNNCIQLLSGLSVPLLTTLKELTITETCREFTPDEIADILRYSLRCRSLEKLW